MVCCSFSSMDDVLFQNHHSMSRHNIFVQGQAEVLVFSCAAFKAEQGLVVLALRRF